MDDLQRAIKWLEEEEKRATANIKAMPAFNNLFIQHQKNCRVLLDALRWVPISDRLPTEDDADDYGKVLCLWVDDDMEAFSAKRIEEWNRIESIKITHWRALPPKPEGSE